MTQSGHCERNATFFWGKVRATRVDLLSFIIRGSTRGRVMGREHTCCVLLIYPRCVSETFWNFAEACELVGARYPAGPLGLITSPPCCHRTGRCGSMTVILRI